MTASDSERVSNSSLQKQISDFTAQLRQDFMEIKTTLASIEERVRKLENNEAGCHPLMESRLDAAWRKLDEHDKRMLILSEAVSQLQHTNKLLTWIGGLLGSTVLIWLLTQILGVIR